MKNVKSRKLLAVLLCLLLSLSLLPMSAVAVVEAPGSALTPLDFVETLKPKLDGVDIEVDWYSAVYVANPYDVNGTNRATGEPLPLGVQQKVNVYVPENATAGSPIILLLNNGGWVSNDYPTNTIVSYTDEGPANGDYSSTAADDRIGAALNAGYVVVSYGARSRGQTDAETNDYIGHSPATVADTKAVITYLRWSAEEGSVPVGNTDFIVVTGTSGGGALSTLICATGNSADFYEELYTIGAAGVWKDDDGAYHSEYGDDVFATIAYCPIIELPDADAAYEWTYYETRAAYAENEETEMPLGTPPLDLGLIYGEETLVLSEALAEDFVAYFDALGLKDESGKALSAADGTFKKAILGLLEKGVEKALAELALGSALPNPMGEYDWLDIGEDGKASIDWDSYLYWVGMQTALKYVPAFGNIGTPNEHPSRKENDLVGRPDQRYSHWNEWAWDNDIGGAEDVGLLETGLTWAEFLADDPDADLIREQIKMLNALPYLISDEGDSAPYWYVRHGMADRDTSFAIEGALYYALINDDSIKDVNFNFAWLKPHSGNYDVPEAYAWLADVLAAEGYTTGRFNPFSDVKAGDWFIDAVLTAFESGLIAGRTATTFAPAGNMSYAESVTLAARLHQLLTEGEITLENAEESGDAKWYDTYVAYAKENDIISDDYEWGENATRAGYMGIFVNALPEEALKAINTVEDGAIPDVPMDYQNAEAIYTLYRAGIVQGVDGGDFRCDPESNIKRSEVATVLARILSEDARVSFTIAA